MRQRLLANVRSQLYLCSTDGRPQQCTATKNANFTVLGFTAENGEPVMCVVIFTAKSFQVDGDPKLLTTTSCSIHQKYWYQSQNLVNCLNKRLL
jgi:hypothetical protein